MLSVCLSFIQLLRLLLLPLCLLMDLTDEDQSCAFDALKPLQVPLSEIVYRLDSHPLDKKRLRWKREAPLPDELFAPIRIASFFYNMDLEADQKEELKSVIKKSLALIENIFSVIRVQGRLLLSRTGCRRTWQEGNNAGRCNFIQRGYSGEWCAEEFQIPDDHLEGLGVWDDSHPNPIQTIFHDGPGINGADFILYAQSISSPRCYQGGLIAYATYCHLDQNGRPIAAYINICPQMIRNRSNKVTITVLHELFHALGFSSDLFSRFKRCHLTDDGLVTCRPLSHPVRYVNGAKRVVTDRVAEMTSQHLNCYTNHQTSFGAILQTEAGEVKSHWDAAFLQGSLMMPTIAQPHLMFLDNITLALFEDSGWYKVNYSYAQDFLWGRGEGCDFGLDSNCHDESSLFFCQQSQSTGCHHLHQDKGRCETNQLLHGCRIYDPKPEDSCGLLPLQGVDGPPHGVNDPPQGVDDPPPPLHSMSFGESFGPSSRCFRASLSQEVRENDSMQPFEGRCLQHWCNATKHLFVAVKGNWIFCPAGTLLQVAGLRGVIECPMEGVLCSPLSPIAASGSTLQPFTTGATSSSRASTGGGNSDDVLWLEMLFGSLPVFDNGTSEEEMEQLAEKMVQRIHLTIATLDNTWCNLSNISAIRSRNVVQLALSVFNHRLNYEEDVVVEVMELLKREVDAGNFSFVFSGSVHTAKAIIRLLCVTDSSHSIPTTLLPPLSTVGQLPLSSHVVSSGLISAIAIGSVICLVMLTVVIVIVARCCLARQQKDNQRLSTEPSTHASVV